MGQPLSLPDDLAELHPEIHASLGKLAGMNEDERAGMGLTFQVTFLLPLRAVADGVCVWGGVAVWCDACVARKSKGSVRLTLGCFV
jgi:hypothetical protein